MIERNHRILGFEAARPRDVLSLQNWVNGNGCIAREETAYPERGEELLSVSSSDDRAITWLEILVGGILVRLSECIGQV